MLALGTDYRYGGDSPATGYDCSGLVAHVFEQAWGLELPHNARAQSEIGTPVSLAELQPGDLVFYNTQHRAFSHVGICLGNGRFVHAPKTGARVRVEPLRARSERQCRHRAGEKDYEIASLHSPSRPAKSHLLHLSQITPRPPGSQCENAHGGLCDVRSGH